jgi:hypothetical protein
MKGTDPTTAPTEQYDRELNVRAVLWTGAVLAAGTIVICLLMWGMYRGLAHLARRRDPAPPPLAEERRPQPLPPAPRLQSSPDEDMATFRAEEDRTLGTPAWIDRQAGIVRLPIDLAMDVLARRGLAATGAGAPGQTPPGAETQAPPALSGPEPPRSRQ